MAAGGLVTLGVLVVGGLALRSDDHPARGDTRLADRSSTTTSEPGPATAPDTWRELPPGPLSARSGSSTAWTGTEMVIVGGSDAPPCLEEWNCVFVDRRLGAGAAFNPSTNAWRSIASAPFVFSGAPSVWAGTHMLVLANPELSGRHEGPGTELLAYDPKADVWTRLATPPDALSVVRHILWTGDVAVFATGDSQSGARDWTYDPVEDGWSPLVADPIGCSYDRDLVLAGNRLVLFALPCSATPGADGPSLYRSAVLDLDDSVWRVLPDSEIAGWSNTWSAVGELIVNPTGGYVNGGRTNPYDRPYPLGGILDLRTDA